MEWKAELQYSHPLRVVGFNVHINVFTIVLFTLTGQTWGWVYVLVKSNGAVVNVLYLAHLTYAQE